MDPELHLCTFLDARVAVQVGDITKQHVDAIVNAANASLMGGGGVDGAIHRAGGPDILRACEDIRRTRCPEGLPTGAAVITTAGRLPARFVIHTVGPVWGEHGDRDAALLASCYRTSLALAVEHGCTTVAFPAISTGVYGYPKDQAAVVSSEAIREFLAHDRSLAQVRLVFFSAGDATTFVQHQRFASSVDEEA